MTKRPESDILADIREVYARLAPECLSCDGELNQWQVNRRRAGLNDTLGWLMVELGRELTEDELEEYQP